MTDEKPFISHGFLPAAAGCFVVTADFGQSPPVAYHVPIVGWQHVQGNMCFPMTAMNFGGVSHGSAILHESGWITDPTHRLCFENLQEWIAFIRTAKPKDTAKTGAQLAAEAKQKPAETAAESDEDEPATQAPAKRTAPAGGGKAAAAAVNGIVWDKKTYSGKSFWQCERGIFMLEGGVPYPKTGATKVTRDQYAAAKRAGASVIDPLASAEEPETTTEDEDDGMDLV